MLINEIGDHLHLQLQLKCTIIMFTKVKQTDVVKMISVAYIICLNALDQHFKRMVADIFNFPIS